MDSAKKENRLEPEKFFAVCKVTKQKTKTHFILLVPSFFASAVPIGG